MLSVPERVARAMALEWQLFWTAYRLLNHRDEISRLVAWASRKRLSGPGNAYQRRLGCVERELVWLSRCYPSIYARAALAQWLSQFFRSEPRAFRPGSASSFRSPYRRFY